jgi:hypothetical protein
MVAAQIHDADDRPELVRCRLSTLENRNGALDEVRRALMTVAAMQNELRKATLAITLIRSARFEAE